MFYLFHIVEKVKYIAVVERLGVFKVENFLHRPTMVDNIFHAIFGFFMLNFKPQPLYKK